jgi:hypothetical protein
MLYFEELEHATQWENRSFYSDTDTKLNHKRGRKKLSEIAGYGYFEDSCEA